MFRKRMGKSSGRSGDGGRQVYDDMRGMALGLDPAAAGLGSTATIGAGEHDSVAEATRRLVTMAEEALDGLPAAADDALPAQGHTTIRVLARSGQRAVTAPEDDFGNDRHEHSPLFHAAHAVITEVRLLQEEQGY